MSPQANKPVEGTRIVLIALGLALLAVLLNFMWIQRIRNQNEATTMTIYLLTRDVKRGEVIVATDFEARPVPKTTETQTTFENMHATTKKATIDNYIGTHWGRSASQGWLVTDDLFREPVTLGTLPPPALDKAHIAIPVTDVKGPGDLRQGDFVRLRAPFRTAAGGVEMLNVIEKVKIVQLGPTWTSEESGRVSAQTPAYRSATLEIYLSDVPVLDAICKGMAGEFEMARINPEVKGSMEITKEAQDALRHLPAPPPRPAGRSGGGAAPPPSDAPSPD